ncbi:MAG TPA: hypothetical protein VK166_02290 [Chitinophagaceae bacterium]|nr:hypothetical protein [Chitinophagaceae bacterium]
MLHKLLFIWCMLFTVAVSAQQKDTIDGRVITLSEVIIRSGTDVKGFVNKVKLDTSFYKAFKNLRVLNFTSLNDIRMMDKKGATRATLSSRTRQYAANGCRYTKKESEEVTGDFYDKKGDYNYYTAELYSSLFFAFDTVCNQTNIVKGAERSLKNKSGIEKNKEQLKMLFFNPGMKIPGIPLMGDKAAMFDDDMSKWYDFGIDIQEKNGLPYYVFTVRGKTKEEGGDPDKLVIDKMTTWFDYKSFDVLSRTYSLSYKAGLYSFNVDMEVELSRFGELLVPTVIRYNGQWSVVFKKKEKGVFTATLFDFKQ